MARRLDVFFAEPFVAVGFAEFFVAVGFAAAGFLVPVAADLAFDEVVLAVVALAEAALEVALAVVALAAVVLADVALVLAAAGFTAFVADAFVLVAFAAAALVPGPPVAFAGAFFDAAGAFTFAFVGGLSAARVRAVVFVATLSFSFRRPARPVC